jgi:hypothetical protein
MKKVGILYICIGKYDLFWKSFYKSAQKYLFPDCNVEYFVFTDSTKIRASERIHIIYQQNLGWPNNTLKRFDLFLKIEKDLSQLDYIFFFNANIVFNTTITSDIFPSEFEDGLLGVIHPYFYNKTNRDYPYERNELSKAYIQYGDGENYFMGSFNGGEANSYIKLIKTLKINIEKDLSNRIIAIWHDESHLNAYYLHKHIKVLSPSYAYPENADIPFVKKIIILDKTKYGGHSFLRSTSKFTLFELFNKALNTYKIKKKFSL